MTMFSKKLYSVTCSAIFAKGTRCKPTARLEGYFNGVDDLITLAQSQGWLFVDDPHPGDDFGFRMVCPQCKNLPGGTD